MKKSLTVILIFVVIVIIHFVVIRFFYPSSEEKNNKPEQTKEETAAAKDIKKPKKPGLRDRTNPRFGERFDYQNAVKGNIPELPGSKDATTGILIDLDTRAVLWAKNPWSGAPIASMTKMMTLLLTFEDLENRDDLTLDTPVKVSPGAQKVGGSQVYLDPSETFPLKDLLKAITIKSANDAAFQVAEFLSNGNLPAFVARMNEKAKDLKMPSTVFYTPHGLPGATHQEICQSSPEGMAILAEHLLEYPQITQWSSTWQDNFREKGTKGWQLMTNTNKLLHSSAGVDGMKTGYIKESGFCMTVTCKRGDHRLVAVVTGFKSGKERNKFVAQLLDWGYKREAGGALKAPAKNQEVQESATPEKTAKPEKSKHGKTVKNAKTAGKTVKKTAEPKD